MAKRLYIWTSPKCCLNGVESNVCYLEAGVPQGSIFGTSLVFDINDIVMECFINLFADDTSVQQPIIDITYFDKVNRDLQRLTVFGEQ